MPEAEAPRFEACASPGEAELADLSRFAGDPPLLAPAVLRALAPPGARLVTCGVRRGGRLVAALAGWERGLPYGRTLTFPALPAFAERSAEVAECLWGGLGALARRRRAPWVELSGLYGAACAVPRSLGPLRALRWRRELVMDLAARGDGSPEALPEPWRAPVQAAVDGGLTLEVARGEEALGAHLAAAAAWGSSPAGGEDPPPLRPDAQARLLRAGLALVARAEGPRGVLASLLVLDARPQACLLGLTAAPGDEGHTAAAFLLWRTGARLAAEGARSLHLGGLTEEAPLPALRLRRAFGGAERHALHLVMAAGPRWPVALEAAWRMGWRSPLRLARAVAGRVARLERFEVHGWEAPAWRAAALPPGMELRQLGDEELVTASIHSDALGTHRGLLRQSGVNGAWGLFVDGELAHVSWVLTRALLARLPLAHLRLADDEAELGNCVTLPRFRGRGLYPLVIRALSGRLFEGGVRRVYLVTARGNAASVRGIEKAGPSPCGRVSILWLRALGRARVRREVPGMAAPVEWVDLERTFGPRPHP